MALSFSMTRPGFFPGFSPITLTPTVTSWPIRTRVYPLFYKEIIIEAAVPPQWGACSFNIYRSEGQEGPWTKVNAAPYTSTFFTDTTTQDFSKFMHGWYIVECILPSGQIIQAKPNSWNICRHEWVEIRATEIQRRETILLSKFTGAKCLYFRRKHFGQRCTNCWNFIAEKVMQDHCQVCLGTSFQGGYFPGINTFVQFNIVQNATTLDYKGKDESNTPTAWTISQPEMDTYDLILRLEDMALFRIEGSQNTQLQAKVLRQIMQLCELSRDSVEYALVTPTLPSNITS